MLDSVEAEHYSQTQHLPDLELGRIARSRNGREPLHQPSDYSVDSEKNDFFLAPKMQVNGAFSNADFAGQIINRHLLITVARQKAVGGVENAIGQILAVFNPGHGSELLTRIVFWSIF